MYNFIQLALDVGLDPAPLLTEARRGEGAFIVYENNERYLFKDDPLGEMAPRDVVSRSIHKHKLKGHSTFLDCRHFKINFERMFPTASQYLKQASISPSKDFIPIIPAAHYHMGGIKVDINGRTSVDGLWACGECSSTGAHGANRLASNSLLEAFVFSKRIADTINSEPPKKVHKLLNIENYIPKEKTISKIRAKKYIWQLRSAMNKFVGVDRNKSTLDQAFIEFIRIERETKSLSAKLKDMLLVSKLITFAAMQRKESRGTHFRSDYPFKDNKLLKRNVFTQNDLFEYLNKNFKKRFNFMSRIVYLNGKFIEETKAKVSVFDRALLFSDALYEVTSVLDGKLIDFDNHMKRLDRSMSELKYPRMLNHDEIKIFHKELVKK